jgi:sigma-E factor negative regulatory protein RseC
MIQEATVREVRDNGMAQVQIRRLTACGHECSECAGCTQVITGETLAWAHNQVGAGVGDVVTVESESTQVLTAAAMVYILPFFLFFVIYLTISSLLGSAESVLPVVGGLLGFLMGVLGAIGWDRRAKRKRSLQFRIVEIKRK